MHVTPGPTLPGEQSPSLSVALASDVPVKRRWRRTAAMASSSVGCATPATAAADAPLGAITGRSAKPAPKPTTRQDRKSVVEGKSVSERVDLGGPRLLKNKKKHTKN